MSATTTITADFNLSLAELDDIRHCLRSTKATEPLIERLAALVEKLDPWKVVMDGVKAGTYGDPQDVRHYASRELEERMAGSGCGISSSDINHTIYSMVRSGQISAECPATQDRTDDEYGFRF